ncbi:MAG: hypothetical protein PVI03_07375 [Candidatus Thorarchaeota archaeon]|jgi:hypothetical protein
MRADKHLIKLEAELMFNRIDDDSLERLRRVARKNRLTLDDQQLTPINEAEQLRNGLNGRIYTAAELWMLPLWVRLQNQKTPFDENGVSNDHLRNWTIIGNPGAKSYAVTDESGLLTAVPQCGSLDFWPEDNGELIYPATADRDGPRLSLISPEDQIFEWKVNKGPIEFSRHIYHAIDNNEEGVYNEILVKNHSLKEASFVFYAVLRPMSVRGVEPIETLEYDKEKCKLFANGMLAFSVDKRPDSVVLSTGDNPNLPETIMTQTERMDIRFSAARGLATAVLRYKMTLPPAASKRFFFTSPLKPITKSDELVEFPARTKMRDITVGNWFDFLDSTTGFAFPNRDLDPLIVQAKGTLAIKAKSAILDAPDVSWREKARVLLALSRTGCGRLAKELSLAVGKPTMVPKDADSSVLGPYLWGTLQYYIHSSDVGFLRSISAFIDDMSKRLLETIEEQQIVPEPPATTEVLTEILTPEDKEFLGVDEILDATKDALGEPADPEPQVPEVIEPWQLTDLSDALWILSALVLVSNAYDTLGNKERFDSISEAVVQYMSFVSENAERLAAEEDVLAYAKGQTDALTLLDAIVLLGGDLVSSDFVEAIVASVNSLVTKHLIRLPEPDGRVSSHLGLRLAHYYVLRKDEFATLQILERMMEFVSEFYTIPEFVNPRTSGGSHGDGCSLMAAVDLLLLVREMILSEDGEDLVILPAISDEWYTSSIPLTVKSLPTSHGEVNIGVGVSTNQHQIEVRMKNLPRELIIYVPTHFALPMMKAYGGGIVDRAKDPNSPYIRIMPLSTNIVATVHR